MVFVSALHRYSVKALSGSSLDEASVEPWGLAGDRRWMVVDRDGRFLTQRQHPELATCAASEAGEDLYLKFETATLLVARPKADASTLDVRIWKDWVEAADAGEAAAAFFSARLGIVCRLVYMHEPATARPIDPDFAQPDDRVSFADGFPLLLTATASLADLNTRLEGPVPMDRFRPNLVIDGCPAWSEDAWRRIRVGKVLFDVVKPCARCAVTTVDQRTGVKNQAEEPIRALQRFRRDARGQVLFGQNLIPRDTGVIRRGDPVEIIA